MNVYTCRKNESSVLCSRPHRYTSKNKFTGIDCSYLMTLKILINYSGICDMSTIML